MKETDESSVSSSAHSRRSSISTQALAPSQHITSCRESSQYLTCLNQKQLPNTTAALLCKHVRILEIIKIINTLN